MSRVPRRIKSKAKSITPLDLGFLEYEIELNYGDGFDKFLIGRTFSEKINPQALWSVYGKEFLTQWIKDHPCTRPVPWWQWDAPRWNDPFEGCFYHGTLAEPRRRLGGTGTPRHEVLGYGPHFFKGIPDSWVTEFEQEYYSGRAKDIHGNTIPTKHKKGDFTGKAIDENNPPVFESEAAYLARHHLLSDSEKKHLVMHPELLEPEIVEIFEAENDK
jgi:hypothetical protein